MSKLPIFGLFLSVGNLSWIFSRFFSWFFRFFSIELGPCLLNKLNAIPVIAAEDVEPGIRLVGGQDEGGRRRSRPLQRGIPFLCLGEPLRGRHRQLLHLLPQFVLAEAVARC